MANIRIYFSSDRLNLFPVFIISVVGWVIVRIIFNKITKLFIDIDRETLGQESDLGSESDVLLSISINNLVILLNMILTITQPTTDIINTGNKLSLSEEKINSNI